MAIGGADNTNSVFNDDNVGLDVITQDNNGNYYSDSTMQNQLPNPTQSSSSSFLGSVGNWLSNNLTGQNGFASAALLPAIGMAINQFDNARRYENIGNDAADRADPFGSSRQAYIERLNNLYKDPSSIADTPGYKFALNQALDNTQGRLASMGYGGTGTMADALATQASGLAQQTFNQERNALMQLSGSQFDPANAARMQMQGAQLGMEAQSNALGALFYPFGAMANGGTTVNNNNSGGNGGNGGANGTPNNLQGRLQQAVSSGAISPADAATLFQRIMTSQGNISDGDISLLNHLGIPNNVDLGGMDVAPGSYDSSGFGGYGSAFDDPTLSGINFGGDFSPFNYDDLFGQGYNFGDDLSSGFGAVDPFSGSAGGSDFANSFGGGFDPTGGF